LIFSSESCRAIVSETIFDQEKAAETLKQTPNLKTIRSGDLALARQRRGERPQILPCSVALLYFYFFPSNDISSIGVYSVWLENVNAVPSDDR